MSYFKECEQEASLDLSHISQNGVSHQSAVEEEGESPDAVDKSDCDEHLVCMVCQYLLSCSLKRFVTFDLCIASLHRGLHQRFWKKFSFSLTLRRGCATL